jgi:DNA-binding response OmpR family regulator
MMETRKRVLVVEDSLAQAHVLRQALEREGVIVFHAPNGRIGVSMAQRLVPDAIVLDIEMPEMNGLEACQQLKADARTADIPVVMLTVRDEVTMATQGLDLGAIDYIPKDAFSTSVLLETLRQLHVLS